MNDQPKNLADNLSSNQKYLSSQPNSQINPKQSNEEFDKLKKKLDAFTKKLTKKFPFIKAVGILPANSSKIFEEDEGLPKEIIETKPLHLMMIIPEDEFKNIPAKIKPEVVKLVKESGENLWVHIKTSEVDIWNYGLDSKYEFLDAVAASYPLHDTGFLGALRVASIHKNLTLNWLNTGRVQYVASYVIGGSLVRGTADQTSDVDTFVIIDDTDVKRMSRIELLDKLRRRITYDFIKESTVLAGVKNILNVQVYLLTDFWQSVKDAHPVMFTFIRDGIPLYDRGTFTPWKRLLQMGKIKPSPEAIDLYMKEGDRTDEIIKRRLLDCMVDIYFGVVTPTQAMMMLAGHAPPVPKHLVQEVKEALVEKEKVMSPKELKTVERVVKLYKDYEHGKLKDIPGKEIDELLKESQEFNKKMKELRKKLEKNLQEEQVQKLQEETFSLMKNVLGSKSQESLLKELEKEMIKKGKIPQRMLPIAKEISQVKMKKSLTPSDVHRLTRDASELQNALTEYIQRKDLVKVGRGIVQISYNNKKAELILTDAGAFVVEQNSIKKLHNNSLVQSNKGELEQAVSKTSPASKNNLTTDIIQTLKKELGNFEIVL